MKELKNYTEIFVKDYIDKEYPKVDICQCEDCRMDVAAMMLNTLPQRYVVSERGELFEKLNTGKYQIGTDLVIAFTRAVEKIKERPRH